MGDVSKGSGVSEAVKSWGIHVGSHRCTLALPKKQHGREEEVGPKLVLRRSAGVGVGAVQMVQDFSNGFLFSDEGNDAEGAPALTFQRVG